MTWLKVLTLAYVTAAAIGADARQPHAYVTAYDWSIGGHNTNGHQDTATGVLALDEFQKHVAACPDHMIAYGWSTLIEIHGRQYLCVDNFGHPSNRILTEQCYTSTGCFLAWRFDVAWPDAGLTFPHNNWLIDDTGWRIIGVVNVSDFLCELVPPGTKIYTDWYAPEHRC